MWGPPRREEGKRKEGKEEREKKRKKKKERKVNCSMIGGRKSRVCTAYSTCTGEVNWGRVWPWGGSVLDLALGIGGSLARHTIPTYLPT